LVLYDDGILLNSVMVNLNEEKKPEFLTIKEWEIVRFLILGFNRQEIAQTLNITTNSVYQRIWRLRQKYLKT